VFCALQGECVRRVATWLAGLCVATAVCAATVALTHGATLRALRRSWAGRGAGPVARVDAMPLPRVMLWAWERPDDLSAVRPGEAGVAYLAGTITLREGNTGGDGFQFRPRLQPLKAASGVAKLPVVRIETSRGPLAATDADGGDAAAAGLTDAQRERVVETLARVAAFESGPAMIQIDFDAAASERGFYEAVLAELRARLGVGGRISITALASWCEGDAWLEQLPAGTIDEAVPMLFRMGPASSRVASTLESEGEFRAGVCRSSVGASDDEALSRAILAGDFAASHEWSGKRVYVFHKGNWNAAATGAVLGELEKWHADFSASR